MAPETALAYFPNYKYAILFQFYDLFFAVKFSDLFSLQSCKPFSAWFCLASVSWCCMHVNIKYYIYVCLHFQIFQTRNGFTVARSFFPTPRSTGALGGKTCPISSHQLPQVAKFRPRHDKVYNHNYRTPVQ